MSQTVRIGQANIGPGQPCFIVAEIGLNHNGDLNVAKRLIDSALLAGCDAVKFQKRTPELCVPLEQRNLMRETPWGTMSYMDYRYKVEFGLEEYAAIDRYCRERNFVWFASCWDESSVDFIERFDPPCYKLASPSLTDDGLLKHHRRTGKPIILSTGMSTLDQIDHAIDVLGSNDLILLHTTSTYPSDLRDLNLRVLDVLRNRYHLPIGYSGHEVGLAPSIAAFAMGSCMIERHLTLDRAMWGSDQAASVEPQGMARLVRDIRAIELAMGDGVKRVTDAEIPLMKKLRRVGC